MLASYHNHTTYSDGRDSIADMIEAAQHLGIDELGFSDHLVIHPDGRAPKWAMRHDRLDAYFDELRAARPQGRPRVRIGLEVDWFPEHEALIRERLEGMPLDFAIGSVHEVDGFPIDAAPGHWERLSVDERNDVHRASWRAIRSLADSRLFDIMGHIDLPKKFGFPATCDLSPEMDPALDAIADAGLVVELNTAGWHKRCKDAYPTLDILQKCHARNIRVTISADAHRREHLTRDFVEAGDRLKAAGYDRVARFRGREVSFDSIEDAVREVRPGEQFGQDDF